MMFPFFVMKRCLPNDKLIRNPLHRVSGREID
jgi:hypothetical protein